MSSTNSRRYWERGEHWDYAQAALKGSSYYKLPKVLQWFSGNIGFHHIHHLSPRIPNYHLEKCHKVGTALSNRQTGYTPRQPESLWGIVSGTSRSEDGQFSRVAARAEPATAKTPPIGNTLLYLLVSPAAER